MRYKIFYIILSVFLLYSCSTKKNIPEGKYLLDRVELKTDQKKIEKAELESYLRQTPNSQIPLFGKLRLKIYNMAGRDTTFITRFVRKIGQAPVIYSPSLTALSANQIEQQLINQGYLNANVDTLLTVKDRKMTVIYDIKGGIPYTIRKYELDSVNVPKRMLRLLSYLKKRSSVQVGVLFDQEKLEDELAKNTTTIRNLGYYYFSKEYLYYKADTTIGNNQVDLFLSLYPAKDSLAFKIHYVRNVNVESGRDPATESEDNYFTNPQTVLYNGLNITYGSNKFLKKSTIYRNTMLKPGRRYSDIQYSRTFSAFNGMGAIKQTNINIIPVEYTPSDTARYLDVSLKLAPANVHWYQTNIEGTNTAGDFGIAPNISYQHQNFLNGGEILSLKLRGSYEFIAGKETGTVFSKNYYEYGGDLGLSFPQFLFPWLKAKWREVPTASTQFSVGLNIQNREEYTRQFFNATIKYRWSTLRNRLMHTLDLIDVNYIRMPYVSSDFQNNYLNDTTNIMFRTMYQDQLISRTGYSLVFSNASNYSRALSNPYTVRISADIGGLLPQLLTSLSATRVDSLGQKRILGIAYAEYWKGDLSFSQTCKLSLNKSFAYRVSLGVANPFGNSSVVPFEKRYFAGGANSVRGWSTRRLGPGSYKTVANSSDFINQIGDIKLDIGLEYRIKSSDFIEFAGFVDAGNIWTIKEYASQPGGHFSFSRFYKEIAMAYGLGLRFDLGFPAHAFRSGDEGIRSCTRFGRQMDLLPTSVQ